MAAAKKQQLENALENVALVPGAQQNLSNLLFFIYLCSKLMTVLLKTLPVGRASLKVLQ